MCCTSSTATLRPARSRSTASTADGPPVDEAMATTGASVPIGIATTTGAEATFVVEGNRGRVAHTVGRTPRRRALIRRRSTAPVSASSWSRMPITEAAPATIARRPAAVR